MSVQSLTMLAALAAQVQTTGAVQTSVSNLPIVHAGKQIEIYDIEVYCVRDAASSPVAGFWRINVSVRFSPASGLPEIMASATGGGAANPTFLVKSFTDAGLDATVAMVANVLTVKVTGLATTTLDWFVRVNGTIFNST